MIPNDIPNDPKEPLENPIPDIHSDLPETDSQVVHEQRFTLAHEVQKALHLEESPLTRDEVTKIFKALPALLMVDDDPRILRGNRRMFQHLTEPDRITLFQNPHEAAQAIMELPDFSLIISDNNMNVSGFTGIELAQKVSQYLKEHNITLVINSGDSPLAFESLLKDGTLDLFIPKPDLILAESFTAIARVLKKKLSSLRGE